jgi:hypothetical protein
MPITPEDRARDNIVEALDSDAQLEAQQVSGSAEPSPDQISRAAARLIQEAARFANPNLRNRLIRH